MEQRDTFRHEEEHCISGTGRCRRSKVCCGIRQSRPCSKFMELLRFGVTRRVSGQAKAAAKTALQLDDGSAEAHLAMGVVLAGDWEWERAEREFRRAIDLKPSSVEARQAYAVLCLGPLRRHDDAIAELRKALANDPLSLMVRAFLGQSLVYASKSDAAIVEFNQVLELVTQLVLSKRSVGYLQRDMHQQRRAMHLHRRGDRQRRARR